MKKLLTLLLVAAMVLGMVGTAFAATTTPSKVAGASFSDIAGSDAEGNITLLATKGIMKGDADATTVRPDATITRAEFAAMVIRMLNKDTLAASLASMKPATKDEIPTWAWGYVNLAQSMGIMTGYPDGTFLPSNNVTFAEALKMLEVAIGWDKTAVGVWPMNYMVVAYDKGLTDGVDAFANTPATRGEVAIMMVNTMNTAKYVGVADDGSINTGAAILNTVVAKGTVNTYEGLVTVINPAANSIKVGADTLTLADKVSLAGAKTFEELMNVTVQAVKVSGKIVYIGITDDANVVTGSFDLFDKVDSDYVVSVDDKTYTLKTDAGVVKTTVRLNGTLSDINTNAKFDTEVTAEGVGTALIKDGDAVVLTLVDGVVANIDATRVSHKDAVVTDVHKPATGSTNYTLDIDIKGAATTFIVAPSTPVTIDGVAKTVADLTDDDVAYVTSAYDNACAIDLTKTVLKIEAFRATIKGEVTATKSGVSGDIVTLKLADGTTKAITISANATIVLPNMGQTVEYRLNSAGKARVEVSATAATALAYVTDKYAQNTGTTHYYAVLDVAGVSRTIEIDTQAHYNAIDLTGATLPIGELAANIFTPRATGDLVRAKVVSVDAANNVVIVSTDTHNDGTYGDGTVTLGLVVDQGLAVYEVTDDGDNADFATPAYTYANFADDTFEYVGTAALAKDDIVIIDNDGVTATLDLIIIP